MLVACSVTLSSLAILLTTEADAGFHHGHHRWHHYADDSQRSASRPGHAGQSGLATWYGPGFYGRRTASGERFSAGAFTAAHRSLPFGTRVQVVDEATGRSVVVRINDRGPYRRGAVIDLSRASASALGMSGTARVRLVGLRV